MSLALFTDGMATTPQEQRMLLKWNQWTPGLQTDDMRLEEVYNTLPAAPPNAIPEEVRMLENPDSPDAYPGAISLDRHDCIHVLLGRGLLPQDEAFVIGFTMGASKQVTKFQYETFRVLATNWYPHPYRFTDADLFSFDLGFGKGVSSKAEGLEHFPFENFMDMRIGDLRKRLGINTAQLRAAYRKEKVITPGSTASLRLDTDGNGPEISDISVPQCLTERDES